MRLTQLRCLWIWERIRVVFCWSEHMKFLPDFSTFYPPMLIPFRYTRWPKKCTMWQRYSRKSSQYEPPLEVVKEFLPPLPTFVTDLRRTRCKEWKLAQRRWQVTMTLTIAATAHRNAPRTLLLLPYVACLFFVFGIDHLKIHPVLSDSKQGICSPDVNRQLHSQLRLVFPRASLVPINSQWFPRLVRLTLYRKRTCLSGLLSVLTEQACWCIF